MLSVRFHAGKKTHTTDIDDPIMDGAMETILQFTKLSQNDAEKNSQWRSLAMILSILRGHMDDLMCAYINDGPWAVATYAARDTLETTMLEARFAVSNMRMPGITMRVHHES